MEFRFGCGSDRPGQPAGRTAARSRSAPPVRSTAVNDLDDQPAGGRAGDAEELAPADAVGRDEQAVHARVVVPAGGLRRPPVAAVMVPVDPADFHDVAELLLDV